MSTDAGMLEANDYSRPKWTVLTGHSLCQEERKNEKRYKLNGIQDKVLVTKLYDFNVIVV